MPPRIARRTGRPSGGTASTGEQSDPPEVDDGRARIIGLERDLQAALRGCIEQLEAGLHVTDGGDERSVASGFIDITAKDRNGKVVVIELKAGTARRDAIGQVLSYMGDVADEESAEVRGILVAGEFDDKARAAASVVPGLALRRYRVKFEFSPSEIPSFYYVSRIGNKSCQDRTSGSPEGFAE